jgi:hypothetical protein
VGKGQRGAPKTATCVPVGAGDVIGGDDLQIEAAGRQWRARPITSRQWLVGCMCECSMGWHWHNLGVVKSARDKLAEAIAERASQNRN